MRRKPFAYLLTFLLMLALFISACGGGDAPADGGGEETTETETTTEAVTDTAEEEEREETEEMAAGTPYKIGVVVASTGGASSLGVPEKNTAEMVAAELAESGITGPDGVVHPVEVIIYDSESNPDTAASAVSRLINEDEVDVIVGGSTSGNSLAIVPLATENQVAFVSMGSAGAIITDPETGTEREWIFKTPHINSQVATWHREYLTAQGFETVCYLYENTGYGQDVLNTGQTALEEAGIEVVYSDPFERSDTEFPQMASVQSSGCQAVVVGSLVPGAVNVMAALRDFVPDVTVLHSGGICNAAFLTLDPAATEGAIATCPKLLIDIDNLPDNDPQKEVLQQYSEDYTAFSGEPADSFGGHMWDGMQWAIFGLSTLEDGLDLAARRSGVRDAMENDFNNFAGTSGVFNPSPDDHLGVTYSTALTLVRVQDGDFVYYPQEEWGGNLDLSIPETEEMTEGTPYKIGVVVAATGGASSLGVPEQNTAEMVAAQLEETGIVGPDGVMHPVEVIIYDSESNPDTAAAAINRLINEDEVDAVLGGSTSGNSLAMVPIATENEVVLVSMGSAEVIIRDPETGQTRPWIFKTPHINSQVAGWHAEYLNSQGITRVCYLYENTGYGQDVLANGELLLNEAGIEVAFAGAFERSDTEFPQMTSVQSSGCEAVIIGSLMPGAVNAMAALLDFVPDIPVLHSGGICNEAFLTLDPTVTEGALVTCPKLLVPDEIPTSDPQYDVLQQYIADYEAFTGGEAADSFGGHAWDGLQWIIIAMSSLEDGLDLDARRAAIRDAMESEVKDWPGTGGVFSLDADDHLGVKDYETALTMTRVVDGLFTYYDRSEWGE